MPAVEQRHGDYLVSDDPARLDATAIHAYLTRSYWAEGIPAETVARSLENSLCIGAYAADGAQVGLARFVTDFATFCYVCDVYVLENHRQAGLAKAMMELASRHPRLQGLRRWNLVTRDAHGLYERFGFKAIANPPRYMEKLDPSVYRQQSRT
jgi:GNAT superfamily N-acetyltransferase